MSNDKNKNHVVMGGGEIVQCNYRIELFYILGMVRGMMNNPDGNHRECLNEAKNRIEEILDIGQPEYTD